MLGLAMSKASRSDAEDFVAASSFLSSSSFAASLAISSENALRMYPARSLRAKKLPDVYMNDCRSS